MRTNLCFVVFFLVSALSFGQWEQVGQEIFGELGDSFTGTSVAMDKSGEIVAVYDSFINGTQTGRVRVFKLENYEWIQLGNDIPGLSGDGITDGRLRISGNGTRIILSNENHDLNGEYSGGVQVYGLENNEWVKVGATLYGQAERDYFGTDVDISEDGNTIIIGCKQQRNFNFQPGYVEVFRFHSGVWSQIGQTISGEANNDFAGESVSINANGTVIALAAPHNDAQGEDTGFVKIFELLNGTWTQKGNTIFGENTDDALGRKTIGGSAIDLNSEGSRIAIGSINPGQSGLGEVRVYNLQSNAWTQFGATIFGTTQSGIFGQSVEMNAEGNIVIVGDPFHGAGLEGCARVFRQYGGVWNQQGQTIFGPNTGGEPATLGWSTAINDGGNLIVVGIPLNEINNSDVGSVTIYQNDAVLSANTPEISGFQLYPNPNNGKFDISFPENQKRVTVAIIDILGKKILQVDYFNTKSIHFDEKLSSGTYLVKISAGGNEQTVRMLIE